MKKKMKNHKYNKGITLVALVVTIIVLIILAGISLNLLLGQNGIMTKAKEAKKAQKVAEVKEKLSLEIASAETDAILRDENLEQKQLEDIINKYGTLQADGDTIITKDDNYELSLKEIWYGVLSESGSYSDKVTQVEMLEKELDDLQKKYDQLEALNQGNSGILEELQGQITELEKQLKEAQAKQAEGDATQADVLTGKTFSSAKGSNLTGSMVNQSGKTVEASEVTSKDGYTYLTIPSNGYYTTSSKIKAKGTGRQVTIPLYCSGNNGKEQYGGINSFFNDVFNTVSFEYVEGLGHPNYPYIRIDDVKETIVFGREYDILNKNVLICLLSEADDWKAYIVNATFTF